MLNPATFIGAPLNFQNKFYIYPPTIKDVVTNIYYPQFVRMLTISQEDITDELSKKEDKPTEIPTPFEFLLINSYHNQYFSTLAKEAFKFFIQEDIEFIYDEKAIEILQKDKNEEKRSFLREEDYFAFQNKIREVIGDKPIKPPEPVDPNEDPRITRIKAKARERDRIKARKGTKDGISLTTSLVAICCMGIGITPLNIGEMSYASIGPIVKMAQDKEKYDIDVRSLLAGADSKKIKPKYWIRNSD